MLQKAWHRNLRTTSGCDMPSRFFRKAGTDLADCSVSRADTHTKPSRASHPHWNSHVHRTTHDKQQTRSESLEIPKRRASVARSVSPHLPVHILLSDVNWRAVIQSRLLSTCPRRPVKTIPMMRYSNLGSVIDYPDIPRYSTVPERNAGIESPLGLGRFLSDPSLTKHLTRYVLKLSRRQNSIKYSQTDNASRDL